MKKTIIENKGWIGVLIMLYGIYILVWNIVLITAGTYLIIKWKIEVTEYIGILMFCGLSGAVYFIVYRYFLMVKVYKLDILKNKIIIYTYYNKNIYEKRYIVSEELCLLSIFKNNYKIKIKTNKGYKIYYSPQKVT